MTLSNFYTTYNGVLLKDDGSTVSEDFKKFAEDFRGVLRGICKNNGWKLAGFNVGHYQIRAFFCEEDRKFVFISFSPSRHIELDLNRADALSGILIRRADSTTDFTGKTNHFTNVLNLEANVKRLMRR